MDISAALLKEGRALIGETLWRKKQPQLRVISAETVAEVAAIKPTMLFSIKVMIHVHPDELPEYIRNIMTIIGTSGQAIVIGKWSDQETLQIGELSWLHAGSRVRIWRAQMADAWRSSRKKNANGQALVRTRNSERAVRPCQLRVTLFTRQFPQGATAVSAPKWNGSRRNLTGATRALVKIGTSGRTLGLKGRGAAMSMVAFSC